jgi:hypothetical protein
MTSSTPPSAFPPPPPFGPTAPAPTVSKSKTRWMVGLLLGGIVLLGLILVGAVILVATVAGVDTRRPGERVETERYAFTAPRGWAESTGSARSRQPSGADPLDVVVSNVSSIIAVYTDPQRFDLSGNPPSAAELGTALQQTSDAENGVVVVGAPRPMSVDGAPAAALQVTTTVGEDEFAGVRVLTYHDGRTYLIELGSNSPKDLDEDGRPGLDELVDSWAWRR